MFRIARAADGQRHHNRLVLRRIAIRLHDSFGEKMPHADYELDFGGQRTAGKADSEALVRVGLSDDSERCTIRWDALQEASDPARAFNHELELYLETLDFEQEGSPLHHLHNLGYAIERDPERNIRDFQSQHGLEVTGLLDEPTKAKLRKIHDEIVDEISEPISPGSPEASPDDHRT